MLVGRALRLGGLLSLGGGLGLGGLLLLRRALCLCLTLRLLGCARRIGPRLVRGFRVRGRLRGARRARLFRGLGVGRVFDLLRRLRLVRGFRIRRRLRRSGLCLGSGARLLRGTFGLCALSRVQNL